jgi:hypothetical protein
MMGGAGGVFVMTGGSMTQRRGRGLRQKPPRNIHAIRKGESQTVTM